MRRTLQAADIAGICACAVRAKDDAARRLHEHFGFVRSPTDPFHWSLRLPGLRRLAAG
ncbi:MAG: hypothetical protein ABSC95_01160 [Acetobacteraceae bacterium]|jgi:hypothetical protein